MRPISNDWRVHLEHERDMVREFALYADTIGCTVIEEAIEVATQEQADLLAEWWRTET